MQSNLLQAKQQCLPTLYLNFACLSAPARILSIYISAFYETPVFLLNSLYDPTQSVHKNISCY